MVRQCTVLLIALGAVHLVACSRQADGSRGAARDTSEPVVLRGDLVTEVLLTGELVAEEADLLVGPHANIWPLQIRWMVEDGSLVEQGDPIVEFDNSQLVSRLDEQRLSAFEAASRLASARATAGDRLATARLVLEQTRAELERARITASVPETMVAAREYHRLQLALQRAELEHQEAEHALEREQEITRADIEIQRIALDQARDRVRQAEQGADRLTLRAPRGGIVIIARNRREDRTFYEGDTVWPGQAVATLPDLDTLVVSADLFDVDDGSVVPGMTARTRIDAFPEEQLQGRVRTVDRFAQKTAWRSLRRTFKVILDVDGIDPGRMLPGMSVQVAIQRSVASDTLLVPRSSLVWSGDAPQVVRADGSTSAIELGPCNTAWCAVGAGVGEGDRLGRRR
jgi:multidrug efflux pump subunit AcrA (membrane-fusion protein)